jgi:hypothetical protein
MNRRTGPRIAVISAIFTLVVAGVGLIATLVLNAFVFDEFDAYGEVPVPGNASLKLPAGAVKVSFHTYATGSPNGGFPIPALQFSITPPDGVAEPEVIESIGGTTSVNSDVRVQVWTVHIPEEGTYEITTDGNVQGYIEPRLAFGHGSSYGWLMWLFGGLLAVGVVELAVALTWSVRSGKKARPLQPHEMVNPPPGLAPPAPAPPPPPTSASPGSYVPSDQGIRLEQIRQLAALRDSGALTEDEYNAEKRRILDS